MVFFEGMSLDARDEQALIESFSYSVTEGNFLGKDPEVIITSVVEPAP
jgi:hypothetical protein